MDSTRKIVILGSTGSIGRAAIEIAERAGSDFEIAGLAARSNDSELERQLARFDGARFFIDDKEALDRMISRDPSLSARYCGPDEGGMAGLIEGSDADLVINALVGISGLIPTTAALEAGIPVALANKETLVTAGAVIMPMVEDTPGMILPVDSEHFSLSRCLRGNPEDVDEIVLTASGGPFLRRSGGDLSEVSVEEVLDHPTWKMGPKVTVDSAHLVNKGLEVIEARWLFGFDYEKIKVVIHPQSIIHSMIRMRDGSFLAHMAPADMKLPLMSAMYHPSIAEYDWMRLDLEQLGALEFMPLEEGRFPGYRLALEAAAKGGTATAVLNAADELGVDAFLKGDIGFMTILEWIENALGAHRVKPVSTLDDVFEADRWTKEYINMRYGKPAS